MDVANIFGLGPVTASKRGKKRLLPPQIPVPPAPVKTLKKNSPLPKLPKPKCALCPLGHTIEFPLVPTDIPNVYAHVECGTFVFETWIEDIPVEGSEEMKESSEYIPSKRVCGILKIPKDRWTLVIFVTAFYLIIRYRNVLFAVILHTLKILVHASNALEENVFVPTMLHAQF